MTTTHTTFFLFQWKIWSKNYLLMKVIVDTCRAHYYRTDFECFQILFDIKKQTRCHLLVNVRRFIETVQYCPLLGSFPGLWQLKIVYINFCCDISQNIFTLQKKHLFPIFVFVFNWMFVWFLYFLFT